MWWLCFCIFLVVAADKRPEHVRVNYTVSNASPDFSEPLRDWMQPIRIRIHDVNYTNLLSQEMKDSLQQMFVETAERVSKILKVFPVTGPLYLSRDVTRLCGNFVAGSKEKCMVRRNNDPTETCRVDGNFQIPDEHFEDFKLHTSNDEADSVVDIAGGPGLANTDTVLYMSLGSLEYCNLINTGIIAFTKICKRDQFGRPIAAFINICPTEVLVVSRLKLSETVFHEMLHALGFTGSSLPFFAKDCRLANGALNCEFVETSALDSWVQFPSTVLADYSDLHASEPRFELVTENARSAWAEHVNCHHYSYDNRGPAWYTYKTDRLSGASNDAVGDHWVVESVMGSIMAPTVGEPYMQVLDNMTIAAFKDMGWYVVSDNYTQPYIWGRNSGCTFSHREYCTDVASGTTESRFLCSSRGETGCHYLHLHKGICKGLGSGHCLAITADEECFTEKPSPDGSYEQFCQDCRCIETTDEQKALCLERRCTPGGLLELKFAGDWWVCPYGKSILVEVVNMTLHCPFSDVLCTERDRRLEEMIAAPPDPTSSSMQSSSSTDVYSSTTSVTSITTVREFSNPVSSSFKLNPLSPLLLFLFLYTLCSLVL
ncbi:ciliated left-right organizer metallopeptidase-like [Watersipora subatra]|uniref:ciliated left-right organizer metallopeptidase-like n=1 Tax=Watersipora subatra TaxID=2589382 RepID=UPI00355B7CF1